MAVTVEELREELDTFERELPVLLGTSEGKWALVDDSKVLGVFETQLDAINQGYRQLGNVPFLVKQVVAVESPEVFVSNHVAV